MYLTYRFQTFKYFILAGIWTKHKYQSYLNQENFIKSLNKNRHSSTN